MMLLSFATVLAVSAQTTGKITYNEKVKLEIRLEGGDQTLLNSLPKERTSQGALSFTADAALYEKVKKAENSDINQTTEDGGQVMIKMQEPDDKFYLDLKEKKKTEQRDFMGRIFLVESEMKSQAWKLTEKQKSILNYSCQEATLADTSKNVSAWFTSAIPVSAGPNGYANLPGMILEVIEDSGRVVMTAAKVELIAVENSVLIKPTKGKKVTKPEFEKIVAEKRKEMAEQYGGSGNMIIKIEDR
jgi:GLPGLI family protein